MTRSGAKLLDFGLAQLTGRLALGEFTTDTTNAQLTSARTILGTLTYMSPEQVEGKEIDHRSDIFSLGCVLYEMVTGRRAFTGESQAERHRRYPRQSAAGYEHPTATYATDSRARRQDMLSEGSRGALAECARRRYCIRFRPASPTSAPPVGAPSRLRHLPMIIVGLVGLISGGFLHYIVSRGGQAVLPVTTGCSLPTGAPTCPRHRSLEFNTHSRFRLTDLRWPSAQPMTLELTDHYTFGS